MGREREREREKERVSCCDSLDSRFRPRRRGAIIILLIVVSPAINRLEGKIKGIISINKLIIISK